MSTHPDATQEKQYDKHDSHPMTLAFRETLDADRDIYGKVSLDALQRAEALENLQEDLTYLDSILG